MNAATYSYPPPIQFRLTDPLQRWITSYSTRWNVSPNDTAKRLVAMAANGLDVEQYSSLVSLSQALSSPAKAKGDFVRACEHVKVAMDSANRTRQEMGKGPMSSEEREAFIQKTIENIVKSKEQRAQ